MYPFERLNKIVDLIKKKGQVKVSDDADLLGISYSTFHRDLDILEARGLVEKVRGGAVLKETPVTSSHFTQRLSRKKKEKVIIAKKAVDLIEDDTCIFIDHSTSCKFLAQELAKKKFLNLVILTNSLALPQEFVGANGVKVILTGGEASHELGAISGNWVLKAFKRINVHQIFMSVGALSPEKGFMTQLPFINEIYPEIFHLGIPIIVLADSSKFSKVCTFRVADLAKAQAIITDCEVGQDMSLAIQKTGVELIY